MRKKQIEVWTAVRNNAAHGQFDELKENDVADLIKGVRIFFGRSIVNSQIAAQQPD